MATTKKILSAIVAIVLVVMVTVVTFGFKADNIQAKALASTYWIFTSGDIADIRNSAHYTPTTIPDEINCDLGDELPCVLETPNTVTDLTELGSYLNDPVKFPTDLSIVESTPAEYRKYAD